MDGFAEFLAICDDSFLCPPDDTRHLGDPHTTGSNDHRLISDHPSGGEELPQRAFREADRPESEERGWLAFSDCQIISSVAGSHRTVAWRRYDATAIWQAIDVRKPSSNGQTGSLRLRTQSKKFCMCISVNF